MKNNKMKELKIALETIECSEKLDKKVLTNINKKRHSFRFSMAVLSIFLIGIISIGVVNAKEIAKAVYDLFISTSTENESGYDINVKDSKVAEINYNADFPECGNPNDVEKNECTDIYSKQEIEKRLGIKILSNSLYTSEQYKLVYSIKNDNKIASISFQLIDEIDDSKINEYKNFNNYKSYISLNTKYAKDSNNSLIEGGTNEHQVYHINNIDKDAVIMKSAGQYTYLYNTVFVYDNIVYSSEVLFKGSKEQKPERIITKYLESYIK